MSVNVRARYIPLRSNNARHRLLRSKKFRFWNVRLRLDPKKCVRESASEAHLEFEDHFTPQQLAEKWGVSSETIRQIFKAEPGVLKIPSRYTGKKRSYISLKIPHSVARRVHKRLTAVPQ